MTRMLKASLVGCLALAALCVCAGRASRGADLGPGETTPSNGEEEMAAADGSSRARNGAAPAPRKKGVGHWSTDAKEHALDPAVIDELGCGWYYTWRPERKAGEEKVSAEFVPMIWDEQDVTDETLAPVKAEGHSALLGFNEPDHRGQADMSVALAIELWPRLMETGIRLGSPATTMGSKWLDEFMEEADRRGYRVDFIALHWYGDITAPNAVDELREYLTGYWEKYHRPLWLTEFSGANWRWCEKQPVTYEDNARFARESVAMLESLPFVERYAWFATSTTPEWGGLYATAGLYRAADDITEVGVAYRDADRADTDRGRIAVDKSGGSE